MKDFTKTLYGFAAPALIAGWLFVAPVNGAFAQDTLEDSALPKAPMAVAANTVDDEKEFNYPGTVMPEVDEEPEIVDLPPVPINPTHPALNLTMDKTEILNIDKPIKSIVVGRESHLSVFLDSSQRLIVVPRMPGTTYFTVIGQDNEIVMQRHVIIASPKEKYVRVRRSCALSTGDCNTMQTYYCPNMCHEISSPETMQSGGKAAQGGGGPLGAPPGAPPGATGAPPGSPGSGGGE